MSVENRVYLNLIIGMCIPITYNTKINYFSPYKYNNTFPQCTILRALYKSSEKLGKNCVFIISSF